MPHSLLAEENDKDATIAPASTGSTVWNVIELSIRRTYLHTSVPKSSPGYLGAQHFLDTAALSTKLAFVSRFEVRATGDFTEGRGRQHGCFPMR